MLPPLSQHSSRMRAYLEKHTNRCTLAGILFTDHLTCREAVCVCRHGLSSNLEILANQPILSTGIRRYPIRSPPVCWILCAWMLNAWMPCIEFLSVALNRFHAVTMTIKTPATFHCLPTQAYPHSTNTLSVELARVSLAWKPARYSLTAATTASCATATSVTCH